MTPGDGGNVSIGDFWQLGFESEINYAFVVWPWATDLVFLSLCLINQMEMIKLITQYFHEAKIVCVEDLTFKGT